MADLLESVRSELNHLEPLVEKRMFGGVGFMWNGNLVCAVRPERLLLRIDTAFDELKGENGAEPMTMGGRTSRSWMSVEAAELRRRPTLNKWLKWAVASAGRLPAKQG